MGVAKVTVNNVVKVDLTSDTVAADKLVSDYTAHGADGEAIIGTYAGGGGAVESDVNFYDYDGTLVKSYTAADFANVTAMPDNPSHDGLIAQGWNWSLSDAKEYVSSYGLLTIGQNYTTSDGKTRIYITIDDENLLSLYLGMYINGSISVNWGDGSSSETISGTGSRKYSSVHVYPDLGSYVISIEVISGQVYFYGGNSGNINYNYPPILTSNVSSTSINTNYVHLIYQASGNLITKVEIGNNIPFIGYCGFRDCGNLKSISIPTTIQYISDYGLHWCKSLEFITIPYNASLVGEYAFEYNTSLHHIALSKGITHIKDSLFRYCFSLKDISIPNTVANVASNIFYQCYLLERVVVPDSVQIIGSSFLSYCGMLTYVYLPSTLTSMNYSILSQCHKLKTLRCPNVSTLPKSFASYMYALKEFVMSDQVVSVGSNAVAHCYALRSLTVGSSVTTIANYAFNYNTSLMELHFKPTSPPTVENSNAFSNINRYCKIYVPTGSLSAYTSATNYPSSSTYTYIEE